MKASDWGALRTAIFAGALWNVVPSDRAQLGVYSQFLMCMGMGGIKSGEGARGICRCLSSCTALPVLSSIPAIALNKNVL